MTVSGFDGWGTYHLSGAPPVSWYEFAWAIVAGRGTAVRPIATKGDPMPARRPLNSVLDCSRVLQAFAIKQPDWREALRMCARRLREGVRCGSPHLVFARACCGHRR